MIGTEDGVLLTDGQNRVFFHPPEVDSGGHGFRQRVDLVGGPFQGSIDEVSYEGPGVLRNFHRQLAAHVIDDDEPRDWLAGAR